MTGADNQQERLQYIPKNIGHYLSGFADGEGSFNISVIKRQSDYQSGWKLSVSFNISQKDSTIPELFKETLDCGTIRYRRDGVCYYEVRNLNDLNTKVRLFFKKFPLLSERQSSRCELLMSAVSIMVNKDHLKPEGLAAVLAIRERMISNRKRKYKITDVL